MCMQGNREIHEKKSSWMDSEAKKTLNIQILFLYFEKLGIEAAKRHLEETTDEILNSLCRIGDQGMKTEDLQRLLFLLFSRACRALVFCVQKKKWYISAQLLELAYLG